MTGVSQSKWKFLLGVVLAIGLFIQLSGKVWIESGSARNTQVYIWLLLPAFFYMFGEFNAKRNNLISWYMVPWLLFLLWVAISAVWSDGADSSAWSLAKRGIFIALYLVALNALMNTSERFLRRSLLAAITVISLGALASIVFQFLILGQSTAYREYRLYNMGFREFADYGWPVAAGIFHGAVATWSLSIALSKKTSFKLSVFWFGVFGVLGAYVMLTYTRGAWFALVAALVTVVLIQNSKRAWSFFVLCVCVSVAVCVAFWSQLIFEVEHRQLSGRGKIWEHFFESMPGHWLFGHGLGTPFLYYWPKGEAISPHAHSLYLQQIYDSGLVSVCLFVIGLLSLLHKAWLLRHNQWVQLAVPSLVFSLVAMLTDVERIFTRPGDYWTVFWLPVGILLAVRFNSAANQELPPRN